MNSPATRDTESSKHLTTDSAAPSSFFLTSSASPLPFCSQTSVKEVRGSLLPLCHQDVPYEAVSWH